MMCDGRGLDMQFVKLGAEAGEGEQDTKCQNVLTMQNKNADPDNGI